MDLIIRDFENRLRESISFAWSVFMEKVGSGLLSINKEASMQLHYSYILQQIAPLICFKKSESVSLELETGTNIQGQPRQIDLVLTGKDNKNEYKIAVEMKCYREYASSGGKRGATDIFMKDVYYDLKLLEDYCEFCGFNRGVALVMNDLERLVNPKNKTAKCWIYDISDNAEVSNIHLTTPIGGRNIDFRLNKKYHFEWLNRGSFWFLENEGI